MTGHLTALGETVQVNTVLIQGQIAVSSVADCGEYLDHNSSPSSPPRGSSLEFNGYVLLIVEKGFFKLGGGGGAGALCHPQDTHLMVRLTSICGLLKVTFFCGVHCIDFSENFVWRHLRWALFKSNRVWFLGLYTLTSVCIFPIPFFTHFLWC